MKLINKSILTIIFSLFTIVALAQKTGFQVNDQPDLNPKITRDFDSSFDSTPSIGENNEDDPSTTLSSGGGGVTPGEGNWVPIDDYQFYLVGLGVLLTGIVVYRRNQLQKA